MKGKLIALLFCFISIQTNAQQVKSSVDKKNKWDVNGYTVKTVKNPDGSYGYLIYKGTERYVKQLSNPYAKSLRGLNKKEDAYKTAAWVVKNIIDIKKAPTSKNIEMTKIKLSMRLPQKLADKLGIDTK